MQIVVLLTVTSLSALIYTTSTKLLFSRIKYGRATLVKLVAWWAATELIVSWVVCIIWFGAGARLDNTLPFTSLSHFAIWTPLGYSSRLFGFYGLSGIVFMLAAILIKRDLRRYIFPALSVVAVATFFAWAIYKDPSGPKVNIVAITESDEAHKYLDTIKVKGGSLVLYPENAFNDNQLTSRVEPTSFNQPVYFVGSRFAFDDSGFKNQLVAGDTNNGITYKIDKSRLIPGGEYLPYVTTALFKFLGANDALENFRDEREVNIPQSIPRLIPLDFGDIKVGAGVCSGIVAPDDYRRLTIGGANVLTNSARLVAFRGSKIYSWHHESMAKLMAISNSRPFFQSASGGSSFGYDINGSRIFYKSMTGVTEARVNLNNKITLYGLLGEYIGVIGITWMLLDILRVKIQKRF